MSEPLSINITGAGDHTVIAADARTWICLADVLLTCSIPDNSTMSVAWKNGSSEVKFGPFYMQNGGTLTLPSRGTPLMRCAVGDPMVISLDGTGTLGGTILVDRGQV